MSNLIEIHDLTIQRGQRKVLQIEHLEIYKNETLCLIGPNGAGKSTLLLAISQLIKSEQGSIYFNGEKIDPDKALAFRRRIALVMQDPLLMDTSVFENVAIGMRFRGWKKNMIDQQVDFWLDKLGVHALRNRHARSLSGGEAQRVSLARAFALNPDLLLLDEPFSALDAPTRAHLLDDFHSLLSDTNITTIFVTHDLDEALLLGDRVAVLIDGHLRQVGRPQEIFNMPQDADIAEFVGVETIIPGRVSTCENGIVTMQTDGFQLEAVGQSQCGRNVFFCLRPEDVILLRNDPFMSSSARNRVSGKIVKMTSQGAMQRVVIDCGFSLVALITRSSALQMDLQPGTDIYAIFKATAVHVIEK